MKPRLRRRHGIWTCRRDRVDRAGHGYTPAEAYQEWAWLNRINERPTTAHHPV